jgi:hypothetical protein
MIKNRFALKISQKKNLKKAIYFHFKRKRATIFKILLKFFEKVKNSLHLAYKFTEKKQKSQ